VRAPAKINLGLRVLGRRPDGYHELESLFLPLDLADEVEVQERPEPGVALELEGACDGVPGEGSNLAARAARAFAEAAGLAGGLRIRLRKRIPAAAGLGGGSSDAGAVLRALAALHPERLSAQGLRSLALDLGADVPFFLDPRPARVTGIGEHIEALEGIPSLALLLLHPGTPLSTPEVYRAWDALAPPPGPRSRPSPGPAALRGPRGLRGPRSLAAWVSAEAVNDLEPAAVRLCPAIARLRQGLREAGALAVALSGSGPTLFGVFASRSAAERAAGQVSGGAGGTGEDRGAGPRPGAAHPAVWARVARTLPSDAPGSPRLW